jgi:hypothetical protein
MRKVVVTMVNDGSGSAGVGILSARIEPSPTLQATGEAGMRYRNSSGAQEIGKLSATSRQGRAPGRPRRAISANLATKTGSLSPRYGGTPRAPPPYRRRSSLAWLGADAPPHARWNTKARSSILSRGRASLGVVGSAKALCGVKRARPSVAESKHLISSAS